jgi:hypothetical protein
MIQSRFIVEAQGTPKSFVENSLKKHIETMKGVKGLEIYDEHWEPTEEVNGLFSALVDMGIKVPDFETLMAAVIGIAPSAVIIEEPEKIEIKLPELQNGVNDVITLYHAFGQKIAALQRENEILKKKLGINH